MKALPFAMMLANKMNGKEKSKTEKSPSKSKNPFKKLTSKEAK